MKRISGYILLFLLFAFILCRMPVFAWGFNDDNYYRKTCRYNKEINTFVAR